MMTMQETRRVRVTLVLRLEDFTTGWPITGDRSLAVISGDGLLRPVAKPDGYFVFVGRCPKSVKITSEQFRDVVIETKDFAGPVLRLWLVPRVWRGERLTLPADACVGFTRDGGGYLLAAEVAEDDTGILLLKEDLRDITGQFHALAAADDPSKAEPIYIAANAGEGCYTLGAPLKRAYKAGARLIPLCRVLGGEAPVPPGEGDIWLLAEGKLEHILPPPKIEQSK